MLFCSLLFIFGLVFTRPSMATPASPASPQKRMMDILFVKSKKSNELLSTSWRSQIESTVKFEFFKQGDKVVLRVSDSAIQFSQDSYVRFIEGQRFLFQMTSEIAVNCFVKSSDTLSCHHVIASKIQGQPQDFKKLKTLQISNLKLRPGGGEKRSFQVTGSAAVRG